jgi:endogenous inhibitor of DNA gyrase (YacG/DUF329 family)
LAIGVQFPFEVPNLTARFGGLFLFQRYTMMPEPTYIKCPHCGTLFGIEDDNGTLHIKFKDLYREVEGRVSGPCRKCGSRVVWPSDSVVLIVDHAEKR